MRTALKLSIYSALLLALARSSVSASSFLYLGDPAPESKSASKPMAVSTNNSKMPGAVDIAMTGEPETLTPKQREMARMALDLGPLRPTHAPTPLVMASAQNGPYNGPNNGPNKESRR